MDQQAVRAADIPIASAVFSAACQALAPASAAPAGLNQQLDYIIVTVVIAMIIRVSQRSLASKLFNTLKKAFYHV
jgi:hypothetical protein